MARSMDMILSGWILSFPCKSKLQMVGGGRVVEIASCMGKWLVVAEWWSKLHIS